MVLQLQTETLEVLQTLNQILKVVQKKIPNMPGTNIKFMVKLEDINISIQIPILSNQELYGKKYSQRLIESI